MRAWLDAVNRRDFDALCHDAHAEVVLEPTEYTAPPGTVFHGHDGIRSFVEGLHARFPEVRIAPREFRELSGAVLVLTKVSQEAAPDGGVDRALLVEVEGELIRRVRAYLTESEALEAAARSAEGGFHAVFDAAVEPMLLLDDDGVITDANRSALVFLGVMDRDLRMVAFGDFLDRDAGAWERAWRRVRERGHGLGAVDIAPTDGHPRKMNFWATADYRPGRHLVLLREPADSTPPERLLTAREREIFELLARGLTAPKIAEQLVLSPATVRTHVQNAVAKLEATTRVQAIARAIARGEIDVEEDEPGAGPTSVAGAGFEPA